MSDVARLPGFGYMVSEDAAQELVGALDQLDRLAAPRSQRLNSRLIAIRREFTTCVPRVTARVDTNVEHVAHQRIASYDQSIVDTITAAGELGITRDGVTWLCRHGHLEATKTGNRWFVDLASLQARATRRKQE